MVMDDNLWWQKCRDYGDLALSQRKNKAMLRSGLLQYCRGWFENSKMTTKQGNGENLFWDLLRFL